MMSESQLLFRRDGRIHITAGDGRQGLVDIVRRCAELQSVVAGDYVFELSEAALWGAAARGYSGVDLVRGLDAVASMPIPQPIATRILDTVARWGRLWIDRRGETTVLVATDVGYLRDLGLVPRIEPAGWIADLAPEEIGRIKLQAMKAGLPIVDDHRGGVASTPVHLRIGLRPYQQAAVDAFLAGGSGLVLLPCGAGKTVVGVAAAAAVGGSTLVLTPSRSVSDQWQAAFASATSLAASHVRAHARTTGDERVSIATYHAATTGRIAGALATRPWDLVIYDEVQTLPADVFRLAAAFQTARRLGLTATLVREDGREREISALVGPVLYDASWLDLERQGWIAPARCAEVRIPTAPTARERERYRLATLARLLALHAAEPVLVVGTRVAGLRYAGDRLGFPVLTGESSRDDREELLERFRTGDIPVLGMSRIGTLGIDLPNAAVLVQLTGTFGSRQEEAQRLGRILRPARGKSASFYMLVVTGTTDEEYARKRQRFLVNQGYQYEVYDAASFPRPSWPSDDLSSERLLRGDCPERSGR